ncbi:Phosphatidylinositol 3-kinase [Trypanosoma melophagium]|uniref:Phosphatidylinositol 3-kinase n=1 Tax=Trypanosoma melophagium TaxID=715481 RepID=UPI00351A07A8|nr:Phosphatidylinositol 3-kinase [Trypanosoma melophagium]
MATNETNVISALRERKPYDVFRWVSPSSEFIAANDITDYFMLYLHSIEGWHRRHADDDEDRMGENGEEKEYPPLTSSSECDGVARHNSGDHGGVETLFVTLQMLHMDQFITPLLYSSHTRSDSCMLEEWIIFPIAVCDVPLDATLHCAVYSRRRGLIGRTSFHPFTTRGELKAGPQRYLLISPNTPVDVGTSETPSWELLARDLHHGLLQPIPWMDKLLERRLGEMRRVQPDCNGETTLTISLHFPFASHRHPVFLLSIPQELPMVSQSSFHMATPTQPFVDICISDENLCEAKASALSKSLFIVSDADAQPGPVERRQLQEIARRPLIHLEPMKVDDELLLWRFRFFLSRDTTYFVPFMLCVNWSNKKERQEALKVMQQWKPISFAQALLCLSFFFREVIYVRNHAINLLRRQSDERILRFLLQLVQGVRYDVKGELEQFLLHRALYSWELCSTLFWYVYVEASLEKTTEAEELRDTTTQVKRYTAFLRHLETSLEESRPHFLQLIRRQQKLMQVLRTLYRTIHNDPRDRIKKMDLANSLITRKKCGIQELFSNLSEHTLKVIERLNTVTLPTHPCIMVECILSNGFYMFKSAKMPIKILFAIQSDYICSITSNRDDKNENNNNNNNSNNTMSRSGSPIISNNELHTNSVHRFTSEDVVKTGPGFLPLSFPSMDVGIIFKMGDDVRQDQLVVQVVGLIDTLLREDGLDLCLTPYRVLATGPAEGLVEVVPDVVTFQSVQRDIIKYIRTHNPSTEAFKAAMSRFIKSFAGYCVLTFILGIGDRHLENILVTNDGRLLHIDFGYILGNDPKPFPTPMKINKEMVEALGGPQSTGYTEFKSYCCSSYNIIRKHAQLILSMLVLMVDASIPQISGDGKLDPRVNLLKVQEKLRLDLSNAQAAQYIQNVIADSVGSIFTNLWDVIHVAAQATRH